MAAAKKKRGSGFDASYLSDLSQQADDADIFSGDVAKKHEELQQEIEKVDQSSLPQIAINLLHDNPYQGRRSMDEEELQKLAADIKESGFQGALAARPHPTDSGAYQIVWGHRRKKAAEMAGLTMLPVLVKEHSDEDMLFLQAKENLLREQLTPLDEAFMFQGMLDMGYTQVQIAEKVKQSRGYVRNRLTLMKVPEDIQEMVRKDSETVRAAYYLNEVEDITLRSELITAVLEKKITGESIPSYLAGLKEKERQEQEAQRQAIQVTQAAEPANSQLLMDTNSTNVQQETSLPALSVQESVITSSGEQQEPIVEQQRDEQKPRLSVDDKQVQQYVEASKLQKILSQLQGYEKRLAGRKPSNSEWAALSSIERLSHTLIEQSKSSGTP